MCQLRRHTSLGWLHCENDTTSPRRLFIRGEMNSCMSLGSGLPMCDGISGDFATIYRRSSYIFHLYCTANSKVAPYINGRS
jgi:hypothetical protein